jgi:hypothetical protein
MTSVGSSSLFLGRTADGSAFWCEARDGDAEGFALARRHYSADKNRSPKQRRFVGAGERMVLITPTGDGLLVWRKFIDDSGQTGVNCAIYRYERRAADAPLASLLLLDGMALAWRKWPGERFYTYINPRKVKSANPGYCFKAAGWSLVRGVDGKPVLTKRRRLLVLEAMPDALTGILWADDAAISRQVVEKRYGDKTGAHITLSVKEDHATT